MWTPVCVLAEHSVHTLSCVPLLCIVLTMTCLKQQSWNTFRYPEQNSSVAADTCGFKHRFFGMISRSLVVQFPPAFRPYSIFIHFPMALHVTPWSGPWHPLGWVVPDLDTAVSSPVRPSTWAPHLPSYPAPEFWRMFAHLGQLLPPSPGPFGPYTRHCPLPRAAPCAFSYYVQQNPASCLVHTEMKRTFYF